MYFPYDFNNISFLWLTLFIQYLIQHTKYVVIDYIIYKAYSQE